MTAAEKAKDAQRMVNMEGYLPGKKIVILQA